MQLSCDVVTDNNRQNPSAACSSCRLWVQSTLTHKHSEITGLLCAPNMLLLVACAVRSSASKLVGVTLQVIVRSSNISALGQQGFQNIRHI